MKRVLIILNFICFQGIGQNLVPNESFELYHKIPLAPNKLELAIGWINPCRTSPDYFHSDAYKVYKSKMYGVPKNFAGEIYAKTGNAYAGIITIDKKIFDYREYIRVRLVNKLEKDSVYVVGFWVRHTDSSLYSFNRISFCLSKEDYRNRDYQLWLSREGVCSLCIIGHNIDSPDWVLVSDTIKAKGNEEYLTIGLFCEDVSKKEFRKMKRVRKKTSVKEFNFAYFLIDDVFVVKINENINNWR